MQLLHLRYGQTAGCDNHRGRPKLILTRAKYETVVPLDGIHADACENSNSRISAFRFEHAHDLLRRAIAEKLSESFLVISDTMLFGHPDKIGRGISSQR